MMEKELNSSDNRGVLYLVPVPLGETALRSVLPDINLSIISRIKHFIVENERSARRFLKKCDKNIDINSLDFSVLDEHSDPRDVESMLVPMERGEDIAVISEAGCPAVADPGALAVAEAQRKGYKVVPLVGPSSILLSLMASGFNGQRFAFLGYLPVDSEKRRKSFKEMTQRIEKQRETQIFIETPYRNNRLLDEICKYIPGQFRLCVASNLTCEDEKISTKSIREWSATKENYDKKPTIFLLYS